MYKEANRPAWAEINLANAAFNIQNIKAKLGPNVQIMGIIKADGYGHGAIPMAMVLKENGVKSFGVAALSEAIALRDAGITEEIVILGLTPDLYIDILLKYDLTPVTASFENASAISEAALQENKVVHGFVAVDSGMGRIGYLPDDPASIDEVIKISRLDGFKIKGLFSHFATADAADKNYALLQEERFLEFSQTLSSLGVNITNKTLSNSAAVMEIPSAHYDIARPGIILYGCYPSNEVDKNQMALKPVMSIKANIVQLKKVGVDFSVGYGRKFISKRESLIATVTLGYADGYPRPYSAYGKVIINGVFAPLAGNICMDQCMIDVTDVPDVKVGDEVILMGSDGINTILADDIAEATGTINYEIVCAFGQRLPKVYIK